VERGCKVWRLTRWKHSSWVWLLDNKNSNYAAKLITTDNFQRQVTLSSAAHKFLNLYDGECSVVFFTFLYVRANILESICRKCLIGMSSLHSSGQSEEHHRKYHSRLLFIRNEIQWRLLLSKSTERYGQRNTTFFGWAVFTAVSYVYFTGCCYLLDSDAEFSLYPFLYQSMGQIMNAWSNI